MRQSTGAQGQPLLWFLLQWYSLTSCERLPSSLSYSHWCLSFEPKRQLPEHLYTLAPSDSPSLSIWQLILCPQPPATPILFPGAVLPSSVRDLSLRNKIQRPSLGGVRNTEVEYLWGVCIWRFVWPKFQYFHRHLTKVKVMMLNSQLHRKDACDCGDEPHQVHTTQ